MWPFLPTLDGRGEYLYMKYSFSCFTGLPDVSIIVLDSSGVGSIKLEGSGASEGGCSLLRFLSAPRQTEDKKHLRSFICVWLEGDKDPAAAPPLPSSTS